MPQLFNEAKKITEKQLKKRGKGNSSLKEALSQNNGEGENSGNPKPEEAILVDGSTVEGNPQGAKPQQHGKGDPSLKKAPSQNNSEVKNPKTRKKATAGSNPQGAKPQQHGKGDPSLKEAPSQSVKKLQDARKAGDMRISPIKQRRRTNDNRFGIYKKKRSKK